MAKAVSTIRKGTITVQSIGTKSTTSTTTNTRTSPSLAEVLAMDTKSTGVEVGKKAFETVQTGDVMDLPKTPTVTSGYTQRAGQRTTGGGGVNSGTDMYFDTSTGTYYNEAPSYTTESNIETVADEEDWYQQVLAQRKAEEEAKAEKDRQAQDYLSNFSAQLSKRSKYNRLAENFETLRKKAQGDAKDKLASERSSANIVRGIGAIGSLIPVVGSAFNLIMNLAGNQIESDAGDAYDDAQTRIKEFEQAQTAILDYQDYLENRDLVLNNAMTSITGARSDLNATYGKAFVDQFYSTMLAKNGLTPDDYSLLTENFRTFNRWQYGEQSKDSGFFDELTEGNNDIFGNIYKQITEEDIAGIKDSLTRALFAGNTELGETLRGYENELSVALEGFINTQESSAYDLQATLAGIATQNRSTAISGAESVGSAQAGRASSGLRGGTSFANEAIAKLSADMNRIAGLANATQAINRFMLQMKQQQLNATSTAYNYRTAMKKANIGAVNSAISGINNAVVKTASDAEFSADEYRFNAVEKQNQVKKTMDSLTDADEIDIVLDNL